MTQAGDNASGAEESNAAVAPSDGAASVQEQPPVPRSWARAGARVALSLVVAVVAVVGYLQFRSSADETLAASRSQPVTEYPPGERGAPVELAGTALDGTELNIADLRGAPVVLNIWGSWCGPCRVEAPVLKATSAAYAGRGVQFIGINVKDDIAPAKAFERTFEIPYPSIDDRAGGATVALSRFVPASVVPATLVLGRDGRVAARVLGAVEESTLRTLLSDVLSEG